jgi:hypothetical protein
MGDVTIRITNTLDQGATDESIGYGDMSFTYQFDPDHEDQIRLPTVSPAKYDNGVHNPTELWDNDCDATEKTC